MANRGPKPYEMSGRGPIPARVIAQRLGVSVRTVRYDLASAQRKLYAAFSEVA